MGLFKEYHLQKELTERSHHDGIYFTKDVVYYDEEGYFWFVSRSDDVIKSSGYRIGPFEVENALMTHPAIVECAITGAPDEVRGMVVKATVVLSGYRWKGGLGLYQSTRDAATLFFVDMFRKGEYVIEYQVFINRKGTYSAGAASIQSAYAPEFSGRSSGKVISVE